MKKVLASFALSGVLLAPRALPATDNFNRADEDLTGNWTQEGSGNMQIVSNEVVGLGGANIQAVWWNADAFSGNHYSQAVLTSYAGGGAYRAVTVRQQSGSLTLYYFGGWNGVYEIGRYDAGSGTAITSSLGTPSASDVLKLEISGTTLTAYVDGVSVGTGSATSGGGEITGGAAGMATYGAAAVGALDNWEGGNVGGAADCPVCAKTNSPIRGGGLRAFFRF
jgi:hypothetical protein